MKLSRHYISLLGLCLFAVLMLGARSLYAQAETQYASANDMYKANAYAGAQAAYEKLLAQGYNNAHIHYNLGNTYYKQHKVAKAILHYERALRLSPDDEDIAHNLGVANAHIADRIVPVPQLGIVMAWHGFTHSHSAKGWLLWAIVAAWLALACGAVYLFTTWKKAGAGLGIALIVATVALSSLAYAGTYTACNSGEAILTVESAYVKSAPDANSANTFMLHQGVKFSLLDKVGSYSKLRLADGKIGWLENTNFEQI